MMKEVMENLFQYLNMFEQEELMDFDLNHTKKKVNDFFFDFLELNLFENTY